MTLSDRYTIKEILSPTDLCFCTAIARFILSTNTENFLEEQGLNHIKSVVESNISFFCHKSVLEEREISHYNERKWYKIITEST